MTHQNEVNALNCRLFTGQHLDFLRLQTVLLKSKQLVMLSKTFSLLFFEAALRNVCEFLQYKHKVKDVPIDQIGYPFIADYAFYLKVVRHISHNIAMRYLKYLKKVVLLCVKIGGYRVIPSLLSKLRSTRSIVGL